MPVVPTIHSSHRLSLLVLRSFKKGGRKTNLLLSDKESNTRLSFRRANLEPSDAFESEFVDDSLREIGRVVHLHFVRYDSNRFAFVRSVLECPTTVPFE